MVQAVAKADQLQGRGRIERRGRDLGDEGDVLHRREARDEVVELEDESDMLAAKACQFLLGGRGEVVIEVEDLALGRDVQSAQDVEQRRFAAARGPEQHHEFTGVEIDVDLLQCVHVHFPEAVDLGDAVYVEDGFTRHRAGRVRDIARYSTLARGKHNWLRPGRAVRPPRRRAMSIIPGAVAVSAADWPPGPCRPCVGFAAPYGLVPDQHGLPRVGLT
jgi:hypothetical protein